MEPQAVAAKLLNNHAVTESERATLPPSLLVSLISDGCLIPTVEERAKLTNEQLSSLALSRAIQLTADEFKKLEQPLQERLRLVSLHPTSHPPRETSRAKHLEPTTRTQLHILGAITTLLAERSSKPPALTELLPLFERDPHFTLACIVADRTLLAPSMDHGESKVASLIREVEWILGGAGRKLDGYMLRNDADSKFLLQKLVDCPRDFSVDDLLYVVRHSRPQELRQAAIENLKMVVRAFSAQLMNGTNLSSQDQAAAGEALIATKASSALCTAQRQVYVAFDVAPDAFDRERAIHELLSFFEQFHIELFRRFSTITGRPDGGLPSVNCETAIDMLSTGPGLSPHVRGLGLCLLSILRDGANAGDGGESGYLYATWMRDLVMKYVIMVLYEAEKHLSRISEPQG